MKNHKEVKPVAWTKITSLPHRAWKLPRPGWNKATLARIAAVTKEVN